MSKICQLVSSVSLIYIQPTTTTDKQQGIRRGGQILLRELLLEKQSTQLLLNKCLLGTTVLLLPSVAVSLYRFDSIFHTLELQCGHFMPWINSEKFSNTHARGRNEQLVEVGGHRKGLWAFRLHIRVLQT